MQQLNSTDQESIGESNAETASRKMFLILR